VRGLGTQSWENRDGLAATFHIVTSMHPDESRAVISQHGVTHIVLPSWDTDLDDFARMKLKDPQASFVYALNRTEGLGFSWLRPLPLELPPVAGSEDQSVLVLEVTDETDPATAQGRFVEYLVESRRIDQAVAAGGLLLRYPADLGSQAAMAQLEKAQGDDEAFAKVGQARQRGGRAGDRRAHRPVARAGEEVRWRDDRGARALPDDGVTLPSPGSLQPLRNRDRGPQAARAFA
jgi:hypothetical protein